MRRTTDTTGPVAVEAIEHGDEVVSLQTGELFVVVSLADWGRMVDLAHAVKPCAGDGRCAMPSCVLAMEVLRASEG